MSLAAVILIGVAVLAILLLIVFELAQILGEGGPKLMFWPRLSHGYEVAPVTRLAVAPWALLLFAFGANGVCIWLFGHDLLGQLETRYLPWLAAAVVPLLLIHLIDYQRSVTAATVAFVLLACGTVLVAYLYDAWSWLPLAAPFLLWSLNGVRALHADRSMA